MTFILSCRIRKHGSLGNGHSLTSSAVVATTEESEIGSLMTTGGGTLMTMGGTMTTGAGRPSPSTSTRRKRKVSARGDFVALHRSIDVTWSEPFGWNPKRRVEGARHPRK